MRKDGSASGFVHAVSLSGGKDSTAMLLLMLERGMPIDMVIFADTCQEFPEIYTHLEKLDKHLYRERGLHITVLRHPKGFEWLMFEQKKVKLKNIEKRKERGVPLSGNGWPSMQVRWCTGQLKTHLIDNAVKKLKAAQAVRQYIGIAADEAHRCKGKIYPLVEWGISEEQALQICYDRGFDFGGLYEIYRRASCWCCPLQRLEELRKLRLYHPELWARLINLDNRARAFFGSDPLGQFKKDWSVEALEKRFAREQANLEKYGGIIDEQISFSSLDDDLEVWLAGCSPCIPPTLNAA